MAERVVVGFLVVLGAVFGVGILAMYTLKYVSQTHDGLSKLNSLPVSLWDLEQCYRAGQSSLIVGMLSNFVGDSATAKLC